MKINEIQANRCMDTICKTICLMIGRTMSEAQVEEEETDEIINNLSPSIYEKTRECFISICETFNIDRVTLF